MGATSWGKAFRFGALALLFAFVLDGFDAAAQQTGSSVSPPGSTRAPYVSTEGDDDPVDFAALDVSLKRVRKRSSPCRGAYQGTTNDGKKFCTHGPDAPPEGVDLTHRPLARELKATTAAAASSGQPGSLPCYGDGVSGARVQAIYAHASDVPDRSSTVLPLIPQWAANVDAAFDQSALQTGGRRHVRWVTAPGCSLAIDTVELSSAGDDSLTAMINELTAKGYNRPDRKYLVWADATRYCGIAEIKGDDQASASNAHNFGPMFGRVDAACWGASSSVEAHELMHMLGGIQLSAPHSSGGWHCTDENDRMCYSELGKTVSYSCADTNEALFDCGHDDYYNTAPAAGTYLATHWNAANNVFLSPDVPDACVTTTAQASEPTKRRRRGRKRHRQLPATGPAALGPCVPQ